MRQHSESAALAAAHAEAAVVNQQAEMATVRTGAAKRQAEASAALEALRMKLQEKSTKESRITVEQVSEQLSQQKMATEALEAEAVHLRSELDLAHESVEAAEARVAESERRRKELHRCLLDLSSGMQAHRQHVQSLQEMHKQREATQAEMISQLQREKECTHLGYPAQVATRAEPPPARALPLADQQQFHQQQFQQVPLCHEPPMLAAHATTYSQPAAFSGQPGPSCTKVAATRPTPAFVRQPLAPSDPNIKAQISTRRPAQAKLSSIPTRPSSKPSSRPPSKPQSRSQSRPQSRPPSRQSSKPQSPLPSGAQLSVQSSTQQCAYENMRTSTCHYWSSLLGDTDPTHFKQDTHLETQLQCLQEPRRAPSAPPRGR